MDLQAIKKFDPATNAQRTFFRVECSKCGAEGLVHKTAIKNTREGAEERIVASTLRREGWDIGNNLRKPVCPECQAKEAARRTAAKAGLRLIQSEMEEMKPDLKPVPDAPVKAEPPPQPKPADNRRIMAALDDAYDEKAGGYSRGESDDKVANSLNVPVAWVREVREKFYGAAMPAEVAVLLPSVTQLENRITEHGRAVQRMAQEHSALQEALSALKARISQIGG